MLLQRQMDLNSVQQFTSSSLEVLKQTMVKQEVVFRNQVHELHRLYKVQKVLMKDLDCKEFDEYNFLDASAQSSLLPIVNPTRYEPLVKQGILSSTAKVGLKRSLELEWLEEQQGSHYGLQQGPFNFHLSADEFINGIGEQDLNKAIDFKHLFSDGIVTRSDDLKLSLSIGGDSRRAGDANRSWIDKKTNLCSQSIILLEESVERRSDGPEKCALSLDCGVSNPFSKCKHDPQPSLFSDVNLSPSMKMEQSHKVRQELASLYEGTREYKDSIQGNNSCSKRQQLTSYEGRCLDLNEVYVDDSSCYSKDPIQSHPSTASSASDFGGLIGQIQDRSSLPTFWENGINNSSNETSSMPKLAVADSNTNNESTEMCARNSSGVVDSIMILLDTETRSSLPVGNSKYLVSRGDHTNGNVEQKLESGNGACHDSNRVAPTELSEKSEVEDAVSPGTSQSQITLEVRTSNPSTASSKSCCVSDNDSSSEKMSGVSDRCSKTYLGSKAADVLSGEDDPKTSVNGDSENECLNKKEESAETDVSIQSAADLLIHLSLENSFCCKDSYIKAGTDAMEIKEREEPQYSCDSFELITLALKESNVDHDSVSSKQFEVHEMEAKDFGNKFRRGRRMKDFQREILPSLASLTRCEIQEDICIMEGALRSREYRRMRGKTAADGGNWSQSVRSRRPRRSYARKRRFS